MSVCCVCRKRRIVGSDIVHHGFPLDSAMAARWCETLGFDRIPTHHAKVCGEHFRYEDYTSYDGVTRNKMLKPEAVPSLNLGNHSQSSSPEPPASARSFDNVSDYLPHIEKILQKHAVPQSIKISHDSNSKIVTISYSEISDPVAPKEQKIICSRCNAIFKKPRDLELHHKICRDNLNPYQCARCNATFKTITDLRLHKTCKTNSPEDSTSDDPSDDDGNDAEPRKVCKECLSYIPVNKMKKHYTKFHEGKDAPFACRICNLRLDDCHILCKHLRSHTLEQLRNIREKYPEGLHYSSKEQEYYECSLCGDIFSSEPACVIHQDTHLAPRFRCPICQRMLNTKDAFVNHLKKHTAN
ncbi:zinc finger protein 555 isoform X1 [Aedes albopictus]|uniref:Uncharacterized protein n=1 Tax=Aedes albopictus TaxID=7160 RepID=A0ABM1YNJ0_AEDAL|nr:zinc finger protein 555 [Aedes albopictus]